MGKQQLQAATEFQAPDDARLLELAISQGEAGIGALERLVAMRERAENRAAEKAFHAAMSQAQSEMRRVSTDATNPQTRSRYTTYGKLDAMLRPVYTANGFSLSFGTDPGATPDMLLVWCDVSHDAGHTRRHHISMPADGKGAKGGDVMTRTHATGAAATYGMRYLLKLIFNVAIGEDDDDGAGAGSPDEPFITDEQVATLWSLIEDVGADTEKFMKWMGVTSLDEIKASRYAKASRGLEAKR